MIKCKKCSAEYDPVLRVCPRCGNIADLQNDECAVPTADTSKSLTDTVSKKKKYLTIAAISLLAAVVAACAVIFAVGHIGKNTVKPKSSYSSRQGTAAEQIDSGSAVESRETETAKESEPAPETAGSDKPQQSTADTPVQIGGGDESGQTVPKDEQNGKNGQNTSDTPSNGDDVGKTEDKKLLPGKYRLSNNQYGMEDWYAELTVYEDQSYTFNANCDLASTFKKVGDYSCYSTLKYVTDYVSIDPDGFNAQLVTQVFIKTPHGEVSGFVVDYERSGERVAVQNQAIQFVFDN